jgi:hypothetical protein
VARIVLLNQIFYPESLNVPHKARRFWGESHCCQNRVVSLSPEYKHINWAPFLGDFAKFRKATIRLVTSFCPSAWDNSVATGRIFIKLDI